MVKKLTALILFCLFSSVSWSQDYEQDQEYLPIKKVTPVYPNRALLRGLEGYCVISFTVTPAGTTADLVTEYCTVLSGGQFNQSLLFERSAQIAVSQFEYEPRVVDGVPQPVTGVEHMITYVLEGGNLQGKLAREERERKREKERERERVAEKEAEQRETQAYLDKISKYEYGTKEKPIVKDFELADVGIYVYLDFGKGVKIRAVRGNLYCTDVFGELAINNQVEDKVIGIFSNDVNPYGYGDNLYKYDRPLESIHNRASFKIMDRAILEAGGIEECTFIPTKTVFE